MTTGSGQLAGAEDCGKERRGSKPCADGWESVIPLGLVGPRFIDLATDFEGAADPKLMTGDRRLETVVRDRTCIVHHGQRLFAEAFGGVHSPLCWEGVSDHDQDGLVALSQACTKAIGTHVLIERVQETVKKTPPSSCC